MGLGRTSGIFMPSQRCGTFCSFIICLSLLIAATGMGEVYRVDSTATDGGDGLSWERAFNSIQDAVDVAHEDGGGDVWVAKGTYTSDEGYYTTVMKEEVDLFGGFAGSETSYDQRDWKHNTTIISGSKDQTTILGANNSTLDGFTVTHHEPSGHVGCYNFEASPVIANCTFKGNRTNNSGAAISNKQSNPTIFNCTFESNYTRFNGGAIYNHESSPAIKNCTFTGNRSREGGGAICNAGSSPLIRNCLFVENKTDTFGGGVYNLGDSSPSITNCTFNGNWAGKGGGSVYNHVYEGNDDNPKPVFNSCIMWGNGTELINDNVTPLVSYCCIQGGVPGEGNIDSDPLLSRVSYRPLPSSPCIDSGDSNLAETDSDLPGNPRIQNSRVDMGAFEYTPGTETKTVTMNLGPGELLPLNLKWRIDDSPWFDDGDTVDVYEGDHSIDYTPVANWDRPTLRSIALSGANEVFQGDYTSLAGNHVRYVRPNATGPYLGTSWETAFSSLQAALASVDNGAYTEIWVSGGTYDRGFPIAMKENVHLYGGFSGSESFRYERNYAVNKTIIDAQTDNRVLVGASNATLDGFIIQNNKSYFSSTSREIMLNRYCSPTISNCIFRNNYKGVLNNNAFPIITNCIFRDNFSYQGGGIYNQESSPCITNCTFSENTSSSGNHILSSDSYPIVSSCIFSGSSAGAIVGSLDDITVTYSCIPGGFEGVGNIDTNPLLDPVTLRPIPGSPCIDAGNPSQGDDGEFDLLNQQRVQNGRIDMGAQEYVPSSSPVSLTVTLGPSEVLELAPQWCIDETDWYPSGATIEVYPGTYAIQFTLFGNWEEPGETFITVPEQTSAQTFNYLSSPGRGMYYVDQNAVGTNTGDSWENAFTDIQQAVDSGQDPYREIWVASGIYTGNGNQVVTMRENTLLYGGFNGTETKRTQRNWQVNKSILDGENERACVIGRSNSCLDGFSIRNGYSEKSWINEASGGGMYNKYCSPEIVNCTFENNFARQGGAIFNFASSPTILNCQFIDNASINLGASIKNQISSPLIEDCQFKNTSTNPSGFISNEYSSNPVISNCLLANNSESFGYGISSSTNSNPLIINSTIINNSVAHSIWSPNVTSRTTIRNSIVWGGRCDMNGDEFDISFSCIQGGPTDSNNLTVNPWLDPVSYMPLPGSPCIDAGTTSLDMIPEFDLAGNERIQNGNIDIGCFEYTPGGESGTITINLEPAEIALLDAKWRVADKQWKRSGETVELYPQEVTVEFSHLANWRAPDPVTITTDLSDQVLTYTYTSSPGSDLLYVDLNASGTGDGLSWENAFTDIQSAIDAVPENDFYEIWVAQGIYMGELGQFVVLLKENIRLYGGFDGTESSRSERDWNLNRTTIKNTNYYCVYGADDSVLDGFVITNGTGHGGGIYNHETSPLISNCVVIDTRNVSGSGAYNKDCSPQFSNCLFINNQAFDQGGAIYGDDCFLSLENCSFINNIAPTAGGIFSRNTTLIGKNNIFYGNSSGIEEEYGRGVLLNHSCLQEDFPGEGNIFVDPLLDPASYRPLPSSPCIDSGSLEDISVSLADLYGNQRVQNAQIDMGAFEYTPGTTSAQVTINLGPSEILSENPMWRLDEGDWFESGESIETFTGFHTIDFSMIADWKRPVATSLTVPSTGVLESYQYTSLPGNHIWYVDASATGSNDGRSWSNAFTDIQSAVDAASVIGFGEIWVAGGTYTSTEDFVVHMEPKISLYGGFAGNEMAREQRDWELNQSIIDGQNERSCLVGSDEMVIDGMIFTNGYSNMDDTPYLKYKLGAALTNVFISPEVANCVFINNTADGVNPSGMMSNYYSSPSITDCRFETSRDGTSITAIYNWASSPTIASNKFFTSVNYANNNHRAVISNSVVSSPVIRSCDFISVNGSLGVSFINSVDDSSPEIRSCYFKGNRCYGEYGVMGGISSMIISDCRFDDLHVGISLDDTSPTLENSILNCVLPVVLIDPNGRSPSPTITNCLLYGDIPLYTGGWVTPKISNCILWTDNVDYTIATASPLSITHSCIKGGYEGEGNISADPLIDPVTFKLLPGSPCIDTGDNESASNLVTDFFGNPRVQHGQVDMGPFEYTPGTFATGLTVHLTPTSVLDLGAKWRLDNGPWKVGGDTVSVYPGDYEIEFQKIGNWQVPDDTTITIGTNDVSLSFAYTSVPGNHLYYVDLDASGDQSGLSWANAFTDLQTAVDTASHIGFGEIWVADGTYTSTESYILELRNHVHLYGGFAGTETVRSQRDWIANQTILDGEEERNCVKGFNNTTFDGFILTRAHGGAFNNYMASPMIRHCVFRNNNIPYRQSVISNYHHCHPVITNSLFYNNSSQYSAACIDNREVSSTELTNCTFVNNTSAADYPTIINAWFQSSITNCIMWNNGLNLRENGDVIISKVSHSCVEGDYEGTGNIDSDPLFASAEGGDFRLLPDSPCIDSGTAEGAPSTDIRGIHRPMENGFDMGAYEFYRVVDQVADPYLMIADLSRATEDNGWFFHRPEMYRDIEGYHDAEYSTWDMTLTNNEMSFGYVESPLIAVVDGDSQPMVNNSIVGEAGLDYLYRATYFVASDLEDVSEAPVIRLRVSSESFQRSDLTIVSSESLAELSPGINGRFYTTYFQMPENETNFRLDLDVLNFDPRDCQEGTISLHYAEVEYLGEVDELSNRISVLARHFSAEGPSGWEHYPTNPIDIPSPETFSSVIGQGLLIRGSEPVRQEPDLPIAMFGYWGGEVSEAPLERSLYQVVWHVGSDIEIDRVEQLPTFRLRFNDETMKFAAITNIDSTDENNWLPSVNNPVSYSSWFEVPTEVTGNNWELSFDYLFVDKAAPNSDDPTAALMLYGLDVFRYDIP